MKIFSISMKIFFLIILLYPFQLFNLKRLNRSNLRILMEENKKNPKIELIPGMDIIDGKCVSLLKGDYNKKTVYKRTPLEMAKYLENLGFKRLHIVDLEGRKSQRVINIETLKKITSETKLIVDFGGGIESMEDIKKVFAAGAHMASIGTLAVTKPELLEKLIKMYGPDKIIIKAIVKNGNISLNGRLENSQIDLFSFINKYYKLGIRDMLCLDISKVGMLSGPSFELYSSIIKKYPNINLIASGGISNINDIKYLNSEGIPSVIFGKVIFEGQINLEELMKWKHGNSTQ